MRWVALLLLASCAAAPGPQPTRCTIRPVTILTTDAITPATRSALRHLNAEIESQCGLSR